MQLSLMGARQWWFVSSNNRMINSPRGLRKIKHAVTGDDTVRVHNAPICIQELHIGRLWQGNLEELVNLGLFIYLSMPQRVGLLTWK